jgi:hypothetical protein
MRWSLRLAEFDFDVEYRAASKIKHIDALSRYGQTVTIDQTLSIKFEPCISRKQGRGVITKTQFVPLDAL